MVGGASAALGVEELAHDCRKAVGQLLAFAVSMQSDHDDSLYVTASAVFLEGLAQALYNQAELIRGLGAEGLGVQGVVLQELARGMKAQV